MPAPTSSDARIPTGYWLCTRSNFNDFKVGNLYPCLKSGNYGYRIYPKLQQKAWAPYWSSAHNRFCYTPDRLDFTYERPFRDAEAEELMHKRDTTPPPELPPISFPLNFAEDEPAPALPRRPTFASQLLKQKSSIIAFASGYLAASLLQAAVKFIASTNF